MRPLKRGRPHVSRCSRARALSRLYLSMGVMRQQTDGRTDGRGQTLALLTRRVKRDEKIRKRRQNDDRDRDRTDHSSVELQWEDSATLRNYRRAHHISTLYFRSAVQRQARRPPRARKVHFHWMSRHPSSVRPSVRLASVSRLSSRWEMFWQDMRGREGECRERERERMRMSRSHRSPGSFR